MIGRNPKFDLRTILALLLGVMALTMARSGWCQNVRFAVVAGNNRGIEREKSLLFAERDAERFSDLLLSLGGFADGNVILIKGKSAVDFRSALREISGQITELAGRDRVLLVVYFSGHSDGVNLEFGSDLFSYSELRDVLENSPAQVKIAIIDSCQSGRLIAAKGGVPGPAFDLILTDSMDADGLAILTSSSVGENSQESGEVKGSFFSHYVMSGLRGAADFDQDRKVTLAEVYQYAYEKTVIETSRTLGGTQHPTYEYQISGRGKVVLTDLSHSKSKIVFPPHLAGQFLVFQKDSADIVAEMSKPYGISNFLVLSPGVYWVVLRKGDRLYSEELVVRDREQVQVEPSAMREETRLIGSLKSGIHARSGIGLTLHYGLMSGALKNFAALHQASLGMRLDLGPLTIFPKFSYSQASVEEDLLRYRIQLFSLDNYVTWRFEYSVLDLFGGLSLGISYGNQQMYSEQENWGTLFSYGLVGGIDLPLVGGLALQIFWEVGSRVFRLNDAISQQLSLKGVVGLGYQF